MVCTIIPMGHGNSASVKLPKPLLMHTAGALLGGTCAGALLGSVIRLVVGDATDPSGVSPAVMAGATGIVSLGYSFHSAGLCRLPTPQSLWQVPHAWLTLMRAEVTGLLYGCALGFGLFTRISSGLYPVIVWALLNGSAAQSAAVMAVFGIGRTVPLWMVDIACSNGHQRDLWTDVVNCWQPAARMLNAVVLAFVGATLLLGTFADKGLSL